MPLGLLDDLTLGSIRPLKWSLPLLTKHITMDTSLITTSTALEGYRITKHLGVVRGITVRSRGIGGNFLGMLQTIGGGKIGAFVKLCELARDEAYQQLNGHAQEIGANAIINMRYDANEVMAGVTEVLAYDTAVVVEKA